MLNRSRVHAGKPFVGRVVRFPQVGEAEEVVVKVVLLEPTHPVPRAYCPRDPEQLHQLQSPQHSHLFTTLVWESTRCESTRGIGNRLIKQEMGVVKVLQGRLMGRAVVEEHAVEGL